jgi:hypothetical protein
LHSATSHTGSAQGILIRVVCITRSRYFAGHAKNLQAGKRLHPTNALPVSFMVLLTSKPVLQSGQAAPALAVRMGVPRDTAASGR